LPLFKPELEAFSGVQIIQMIWLCKTSIWKKVPEHFYTRGSENDYFYWLVVEWLLFV